MLCQPMTLVDIVALVPFYTGLYLIASGIQEATPNPNPNPNPTITLNP